MQGLWSEENWRLDGDALVLPSGQRIKLADIRQWRSDLVTGQFDLTGKWAWAAMETSRRQLALF